MFAIYYVDALLMPIKIYIFRILALIHTLIVFNSFISSSLYAAPANHYIVSGDAIEKALNGLTGNPESGRELVRNQNKGNCLACHQFPIPEEDFHGTIGPSLATVSLRLTEAQLRLRVTDMKLINPVSIMPGFFRAPEKMTRLSPLYENKTILTAQDIEDIVSYLITLKSDQAETF